MWSDVSSGELSTHDTTDVTNNANDTTDTWLHGFFFGIHAKWAKREKPNMIIWKIVHYNWSQNAEA